MDFKHCVVLCTCPDEASAQMMAKSLAEEQLAACTNIIPNIHSFFYWEQSLDTAHECLLVIKTTMARYLDLEAKINAMHPYECPEIIALPIIQGAAGYLRWMEEAVNEN